MANIRIPGLGRVGTGNRRGPQSVGREKNPASGPDREYLISQANKILKTNPVRVAPLKRVNDWRKEYDRLKAESEAEPKEE